MSSIFLCRNITRLHITLHHDTNSSVATKVSLHIEVSFEGNVSDCTISPGSVNPDQILQNEIKASRDVVIIWPKRASSLASTPTPSSSSSSSSSSSTSSSFSLFLLLLFIIGDTCNYEPKPSCSPRVPVFSFLMLDINTIVNNNNNNNNNFITMVSGSSQLFIHIIKISLKIWIKFWVGVNQLCGLRRSRSHAEVDEKFNL